MTRLDGSPFGLILHGSEQLRGMGSVARDGLSRETGNKYRGGQCGIRVVAMQYIYIYRRRRTQGEGTHVEV